MSQSIADAPVTAEDAANAFSKEDPEAAAIIRERGAAMERERLAAADDGQKETDKKTDEKVAERIANAGRSK